MRSIFSAGLLGHAGEGPAQAREERQRGQAAARKGGRAARRLEAAGHSGSSSPGLAYQDCLSAEEMTQLAASLGEQLMADTVKPQTARQYLRALKGLHEFLEQGSCRFTTVEEKDRAVAAHLGWLWGRHQAGEGPGVAAGVNMMSGLAWVWPELRAHLPRSARTLAGWQRTTLYGEGQPEADGVIAAMIRAMEEGGHSEAADALRLAHDAYLREHDFLQLTTNDISDAGDGDVAIHIAYAKTGPRQGVRLDWSGTILMVQRRVSERGPGRSLFDLTGRGYLNAWHEAKRLIQQKVEPGFCIGPPHSVRHSGPSRDAAEGYRSIWQIQRRGRWQSESSVMRYAKTASWTAARARSAPAVLAYGQPVLLQRGHRPSQPRE